MRYEALVARRTRREPVAYILGTREFWGRPFETGPAALVPRPETELIVEEALARADRNAALRIVDVGTGTGCIGVTLALELPRARVIVTDISQDALDLARCNAERLGARVHAVRTDLLSGLAGPFDLIVANPPYVPAPARPALSPDVRDYEPAVALFGGEDGLTLVRALLPQAAVRLGPRGWFLMEFGAGQEDAVLEAVAAAGELHAERVLRDLQGIARTVLMRRPGPR